LLLLKKTISLLLIVLLIFSMPIVTSAEQETNQLGLDCKSAVLIEASTGKVLYSHNPNEKLPPASVTKIMTLLLVMEELDVGNISLTDTVTVSSNASSMGGSQVFLEENEIITVEDLLKSVVIASANDAAVALGEYISGSTEAFVEKMNKKAVELDMKNTKFENPTGLDDNTKEHLTSALDISIMSRELLKHKKIKEYTTIWMDTIRNGEFGLTNTNRLIRFYKGATGLKTGSTSKAGFCISASAERDGMELIAVIMGSPSRDIRNECARKLLDMGFANYSLYKCEEGTLGDIGVIGGNVEKIKTHHGSFSSVVNKGQGSKVVQDKILPDNVPAPVKAGDKIGEIHFKLDGKEIGYIDIVSGESTERISFWGIFKIISKKFLLI